MTLRSRARRLALFLALGVSASALPACKKKPALAPVGLDSNPAAFENRKSRLPENPVTGHVVASVSDRSIGPFLARRGSGPTAAGMVAWVTGAEGSARRVVVVPVGANGAPRGPEMAVSNVSVDTTMLVVRPLHGRSPGFLVVWSALTDRGKSLWAVAVGDNGVPRSKAVELTRTTDDLVWIDIVPTTQGALCVWAEETRDDDANLMAASVDSNGKLSGTPTRIARQVVGWHALELPTGVGVSTITRAPASPKSKSAPTAGIRSTEPGALSFHRLDADGHPTAPPVVISAKPTVSGDIEVVRDGARLAFAWTDRSATEPTIVMTTLDEHNVAQAPKQVVDAQGGALLLGLARSDAGLGLLFEAPVRRKDETRRVHAARLGRDLALATRPLSIESFSRAQPELVATTNGFAVLATTPNCDAAAPCPGAVPIATLFRTGERGEVLQREALTFQTDPATVSWGLTCDAEQCFSLAASSDGPKALTRVRSAAVRFRSREGARPPDPRAPSREDARVADIVAIASGERAVDIASVPAGKGHLVAMLSDRRADTKRRSAASLEPRTVPVTLTTRLVDENGAPSASTVISSRALHVGGIAVANAGTPDDGSALAWVALDDGVPTVHVTRLDKRGRVSNDVKLTTTKGDAANATIAWADNGWIVAWVDGKSGNGEVYATKLAPDLKRTGREERITNAPGDASDLVALTHGDAVWLAWADSRESPRDGNADVFVAAVSKRDAKRLFEEHRILPTAAHSRTPRLAADDKGIHVAWIEEAPAGAATPTASGYGAFWSTLDEKGAPVGKPARIGLAADGSATAVAFEASHGLRAVVARSTPEAMFLDAAELSPAGEAFSLLTLDGPPSLDVALVLDGDVLFFNDDGRQLEERRARRARITWPHR